MTAPARSPKVEQTRTRLLDTALAVFARKGVHEARVEDFCAAAGIARATFYRHFDGKQEVFLALFEMMSQELRGTASELQPVTADLAGLLTLRRWVEELLGIGDKWGPILEVLSQPSQTSPEVRRRSVVLTGEFAATVGTRFAEGRDDDLDPAMAALAVIAMTDCVGQQVRIWGLDLDRRSTAHVLAVLTIKMLHPDVDVEGLAAAASGTAPV